MSADTWILVADAARARIFATDAELSTFHEASEDLVHWPSRDRTSDLVTDARESGRAGLGARSGPTSGSGAHEQEERVFAHKVADALRQARVEHRYRDLVLVAAPHFLGELRKAMDGPTTGTVTAEIAKDYSHLEAQDIRAKVKKQLMDKPLPR